jgi:hypothetical protein
LTSLAELGIQICLNHLYDEEFDLAVLLELEAALALAGCGACAELVDIPVGDTGAVVFSFRRAFPAVTFCASKVAFRH